MLAIKEYFLDSQGFGFAKTWKCHFNGCAKRNFHRDKKSKLDRIARDFLLFMYGKFEAQGEKERKLYSYKKIFLKREKSFVFLAKEFLLKVLVGKEIAFLKHSWILFFKLISVRHEL